MAEILRATCLDDVSAAIRESAAAGLQLAITGTGSKDWLGNSVAAARLLVMEGYAGVEFYAPEELCIRVRAGTRLASLRETLAEAGQQLAAEPPEFAGGTVGGAVAAGLSGPARPYAGSLRDLVLGVARMDGRGRPGRFGGEVMKNVAGFDLARLMAGSFGTLGVLTSVSFKVLPLPEAVETRVLELSAAEMLRRCAGWRRKYLPISASCWHDGRLFVRLSGSAASVRAFAGELGGEALPEDADFWRGVRDQTHEMFAAPEGDDAGLWRLGASPLLPQDEKFPAAVMEWGGARRWLRGPADLRERLPAAAGRLSPWRGWSPAAKPPWQHPADATLPLQRRLQRQLDPDGVFVAARILPACPVPAASGAS